MWGLHENDQWKNVGNCILWWEWAEKGGIDALAIGKVLISTDGHFCFIVDAKGLCV